MCQMSEPTTYVGASGSFEHVDEEDDVFRFTTPGRADHVLVTGSIAGDWDPGQIEPCLIESQISLDLSMRRGWGDPERAVRAGKRSIADVEPPTKLGRHGDSGALLESCDVGIGGAGLRGGRIPSRYSRMMEKAQSAAHDLVRGGHPLSRGTSACRRRGGSSGG